MKRKAIVLFLLAIVPFIASSQTTLTTIQADNLVRLINDYEGLKERHTIVIGRLTEAEEIIWKYGDMINECDRIRINAQEKAIKLEEDNEEIKKRNKFFNVLSFGIGVIITIFITS
jgi:hypothetical protein